mmetsp:Transcript_68866/g.197472  ORF Transcript_68866/g.197472 Transcript_68866/m.197472 type:complete len:219 (-) Transcript_68866:1804-2460(-)
MSLASEPAVVGTARRTNSPDGRWQALDQACPSWPLFAGVISDMEPSTMCSFEMEPSAAPRSRSSPAKAAEAGTTGARTSPWISHFAADWARTNTVTLASPAKSTAARSAPEVARDRATLEVPSRGSDAPGSATQAHLPPAGPAPAHSKTAPAAVATRRPCVSQWAATIAPWPMTPCSAKGTASTEDPCLRWAPRPWRESATVASAPQAKIWGSKRAGH